MLGSSSRMSSYGERSVFMYGLGTVHRSCECKSSCVRDASAIAGSKGPGWCTSCVLPQRASTAWMEASNSSCFIANIQGNQRGRSQVQSLLDDSVVIDAAPIGRASADCRAAHSITGLTGCNPTCISAPAAFPGQWLDARESSSTTGSTLLVGLASDRLPAIHSHPSAQSNPNRR